MRKHIFTLFACIFLAGSLPVLEAKTTVELAPGKHLVLLDSASAASHIIRDEKEGFFEKVRQLEMEIQLHARFPDSYDREKQLSTYRLMLQKDLLDLSPADEKLLTGIFQEAMALCKDFTQRLFPDTLYLIKTRSSYYGKGTYYTRENCIVIPENELDKPSRPDLFEVMMHELFHVFSRYNPAYRENLYKLIGYFPIGELHYPKKLKERLLYNPDGLDYHWAIELEGKTLVPLITSRYPAYNPTQPAFFNYLDFALFEIDQDGKVQTNSKGKSTHGPELMGAYFGKIKDNTNYIIHPDEILADNFAYLVQAEKSPGMLQRFSAEGQKLLESIKKVLSN